MVKEKVTDEVELLTKLSIQKPQNKVWWLRILKEESQKYQNFATTTNIKKTVQELMPIYHLGSQITRRMPKPFQ